jgi:hypothetical protein
MTRRILVGQHVLRVFDHEPLLIYIRFDGDMTIGEARQLSQIISQKMGSRSARFLVDSATLGTICLDSRRELVTAGPDHYPSTGSVLDIVVVGASILQKVVLTQIVTMAHLRPDSRGQTHFFDAMDDALTWMSLPKNLLS